jgi:hypothetical protein
MVDAAEGVLELWWLQIVKRILAVVFGVAT